MGNRKTLAERLADLITPEVSVEEMEEANRYLVRILRARASEEDRKAALQFHAGDKVRYTGRGNRRLPNGAIGVIERFGSRLVSVDFGIYRPWRVPARDLEAAPKDAQVERKPLFGRIPVPPPPPPPEEDPEIRAARKGLV